MGNFREILVRCQGISRGLNVKAATRKPCHRVGRYRGVLLHIMRMLVDVPIRQTGRCVRCHTIIRLPKTQARVA